ncbi:TagF domain-containing protein [Pseudoalteromonas sp. bablab_jr011]|uniref:TagF domain-containing protein n=1 Tax=Pseudoalteromonas sp. bablab_jr011 TaxID=2755062 RepID=UPI00289DD607|nr:TagF domain-containing protein [Pseudoalteromonas sp. bablab_jr011]
MFNLFTKKKQPMLVQQFAFGYMGKTPVRPDFVKLNISSRESVSFDHWLQEGFANINRGVIGGALLIKCSSLINSLNLLIFRQTKGVDLI